MSLSIEIDQWPHNGEFPCMKMLLQGRSNEKETGPAEVRRT